MHIRRFIAPLTVTAAVAGGGITGAVLGVPALSDAQEADTEAEADTPETESETLSHDGLAFHGRRGPGILESAAEALGMEPRDLVGELRDGKTVAQVAEEQGVDVDAVIDAIVAEVVERTDRPEDEVRERVTRLVNEGLPDRPFGHRHHRVGLEAAAEALGIEVSELVSEMRDGRTIAQVAEELGVDVDTVIDAMVEEAREKITTFVHEGPQRPGADPDATE